MAVSAEIRNEAGVANLAVPRGNYSQLHLSGFGYGDSSLETGISKVGAQITVKNEVGEGHQFVHQFQLMRFENVEDYLCYVEAVHLLYHDNIRKDCDFRINDKYIMDVLGTQEFKDRSWLDQRSKTNEYFLVVDNTEWPEALTQEPWNGVEPEDKNGEKTVHVSVKHELRYTSNNKYASWTFIFMLLLIIFGAFLIITIICFCRQKYLYGYYSKERKQIKRQLEIIKETEYANFLLIESENLKRKVQGGTDAAFNINRTQAEEDSDENAGVDDSD